MLFIGGFEGSGNTVLPELRSNDERAIAVASLCPHTKISYYRKFRILNKKYCEIITDPHKGDHVLLPRITVLDQKESLLLISNDDNFVTICYKNTLAK